MGTATLSQRHRIQNSILTQQEGEGSTQMTHQALRSERRAFVPADPRVPRTVQRLLQKLMQAGGGRFTCRKAAGKRDGASEEQVGRGGASLGGDRSCRCKQVAK